MPAPPTWCSASCARTRLTPNDFGRSPPRSEADPTPRRSPCLDDTVADPDDVDERPPAITARAITMRGPWGPVYGPVDLEIPSRRGHRAARPGRAGADRAADDARGPDEADRRLTRRARADPRARDLRGSARSPGSRRSTGSPSRSRSGIWSPSNCVGTHRGTGWCDGRVTATWPGCAVRCSVRCRCPSSTAYVDQLSELDAVLLRIALANTAAPPLLVVGSLDQVDDDGESRGVGAPARRAGGAPDRRHRVRQPGSRRVWAVRAQLPTGSTTGWGLTMLAGMSLGTDLKRYSRGAMPRVALVTIILLPLLYGAMYLWAFWNPFAAVDRVPVALVNEDRGARRAGPGTAGGRPGGGRAAEVRSTRPASWCRRKTPRRPSRTARTTSRSPCPRTSARPSRPRRRPNPRQAQIQFDFNDANNYLASVIGQNASREILNQVSARVGEQVVGKVLIGLTDAGAGIKKAADGADQLSAGLTAANDGAHQLASGRRHPRRRTGHGAQRLGGARDRCRPAVGGHRRATGPLDRRAGQGAAAQPESRRRRRARGAAQQRCHDGHRPHRRAERRSAVGGRHRRSGGRRAAGQRRTRRCGGSARCSRARSGC